jgi:hypothetical protein
MSVRPAVHKATLIRPVLVAAFGRKHARCAASHGTASHWVDARVEVPRPPDCCCAGAGRCEPCQLAYRETYAWVQALGRRTLSDHELAFATYTGDMNDDHDCFSISVRLVDPEVAS